MTRHHFSTLLLLACALGLAPSRAQIAPRLPERSLVGGLAAGATTRSFESAGLLGAIDRIRQSGAHILELHVGQPLEPADPEAALGPDMTDEQMAKLRQKVSLTAVRLVAVRVRFSNNQTANTRLFEWADRLDIHALVGDPPLDQFDHIEQLIRKFNVQVGVLTAPRPASGRAGGTDPQELSRLLRGRDPRFGVVVNLLNIIRAGEDPFEALNVLRARLIGVQLSDVSGLTPQARPAPFGQGRFDFHRLLSQLDSQRFDGYLVFDLPPDDPDFAEDISRGIEFFRAEMEGIRRTNLLRVASRRARTAEGLKYEALLQGDIPEPVHVAICPDGGVWFAGRRGHLWSWTEGAPAAKEVARFDVLLTGQRGLHAFEFDPGFLTNGFVYVYRTPMLPVGNSNRVSRFSARRFPDGWRIDPQTERVLLDIPSARHGKSQGGGLLLHPLDDFLYIGVGDNNLAAETPRFYDDPQNPPQDLASLWGKILRIGRDGSVPPDNPFVASGVGRPEIFAYGLRNPFSLACDRVTGRVYVGDVGYDRRVDMEEVNLLEPGANYGWPRCDGRGKDTLAGTPCPVPGAVGPWHAYPHQSAAAVVVGPFVSRELPSRWPEAFRNGLFLGDIARRSIRFAQVDEEHKVVNEISVVSALAGGPASMAMTEDGVLYVVEYAGWMTASPQDRLARVLPADAE